MKIWPIVAISSLYTIQTVYFLYHHQFWPAMLVAVYALAGIPLIMMTK